MKRAEETTGAPAECPVAAGMSRRRALLRGGGLLGVAALGRGGLVERADAGEGGEPPAFVYCLNTGTIRGQKLGIVKEVEVASRAGFQAIEPWVGDLEQFEQGGGSLKELGQRIRDLGLSVESAIAFPPWVAEDRSARERGLEQAKRAMDRVAQIGGVRMAAPPAGGTDEPAIELPRVVERYRELLDVGAQTGVQPLLELWGFSATLHRLGEVAYVLAECGDSRAAAVLDTFHIYKGGSGFAGLRLFNTALLPVYHINDYPAEPPRAEVNDGDRIMPGDGVAPTSEILKVLASNGGRRVLSLELFNRGYWNQDALSVAREGLAKMKAAAVRALA